MIIARPSFSLACMVVLAMSLTLKVPRLTGVISAPTDVSLAEIGNLLELRGFKASQFTPENDMAWVMGAAGDCDIRIAEVALQGWQQSLIEQIAAGHQLLYAFGGEVYSRQPILKTRTHYYWHKLLRYLGMKSVASPILAVIAAPTCKNIPMADLAKLTIR